SMIDIGNNSNLTGDNITTVATQDGSNGKGLPLYMHGVTLQADGNISLNGVATGGATPAQLELRGAGNRLTSVNGNISLQTQGGGRIFLNGTSSGKAVLNATNGTITLSREGIWSGPGVTVTNSNLSSANMIITGNTSSGTENSTTGTFGGVAIYGNVSLSVADDGKGLINGVVNSSSQYGLTAGIAIGKVWEGTSNILFDGEFEISGENRGRGGRTENGGIFYLGFSNLTFTKDSTLTGIGTNGSAGISGQFSAYNTSSLVNYKLQSGANLTINAQSDSGRAVSAASLNASNQYSVGYVFSGDGNVTFNANNESSKPTLYVNYLDNSKLNGNFSVHAVNTNGDAIVFQGLNNQNLINANITGISESGTGIRIESNGKSNVSLSGSVIHGVSNTGDGIKINGDNTTITNGTLVGESSLGNGSGVSLTGGSKFTLDGVSVTGVAADGSGVSVTGSLSVNNGTRVDGVSSGTGNGVLVSGNLTTSDGDGIQINGTTASGNGILVTGNTALTNAEVTGNATTGTGVNVSGNAALTNVTVSGSTETGAGAVVSGNLTADDTTQVTGTATQNGGTGVTLNGTVTGGKVDGTATSGDAVQVTDGILTNTVVTGNATTGTGVNVSGNAALTNVTVNGSTETGAGAVVSGNLTADDTTQVTGTATQNGGTGVTLNGTVTGGKVDGTATSGNAVQIVDSLLTGTEVSGVSQSGTGVNTQGNVTLNGVELNASSENGVAGLEVSGTLNHDQHSVIKADGVVGQENIYEIQPDTPPSPGENGNGGNTGSGESGGTVTPPPGGTGGDADNNGNTGSEDNNTAQPGEVPGPVIGEQVGISAIRQQAVDAQITRMNQMVLDGFHSAGIPLVPVEGYEPAAQSVDISLCDGEHCQSDSLDTGKPVKENVTPSGR
ncbi:S-layer family protein, partial [Salmonella enterica]|nr:S-layer family protein [Salmonella enterica]